ncbi:MAG: VWA domain-containing protein [Verrucomicrobiales bacterium]|nr:VWA domain-containing protein [Verrucomicrobiales bacterium]
MTFAAPQFLFLIPVWVLLAWRFRRLELWRPLRVIFLALLTLLMCDPRMVLKSGGIDLWVLFDRSRSAQDLVDAAESEWRALLERSRPGESHRLHLLDYASEVIPLGNAESAVYPGNRDQTRTDLALLETLARMDPARHNRVLLFTDGYSTEPLTGAAAKLIAAGVPLDYRLVRAPESTDYQVAELSMPERVQVGEPFLVDIRLVGNADGPVPMEIFRGDARLYQGEVAVKEGTGRFRFSDRVAEPGGHRYRVTIAPAKDAHSGNNAHERWIEVSAGPRLLLVTAYQEDPIAPVLRAQGFEVAVVQDPLTLNPGVLSGVKAVILNNVPAYELPGDFLGALPFYVSDQGGGLLMAGGHRSFGSGGYYESAIDPLLPVSMELKSEHRKLGVAMAIVMDRSGSMAATTPSGHTKMQLANEGAARSVELLGTMDAVTVFAVDSQAHQMAPLLNVGKSRGELNDRIRRIESMGGGIFVYEGLKAAWDVLKSAPLGQRHVILFSDAADSEEPGDYIKLIEEMRANGATLSVIGMGTRSDPDAALLEDIAKRGEGRIFFTEVPGELPNIFAQETVTVARSSFIEDPTGAKTTGRWQELARRDAAWLPEVDGYNLSYLREGDQAALISTDTYAAPLVAFGRRGIGRTAAVSFPLGGDFSRKTRGWEQYGDFLQTLTRWLMGDEVPPGLGLRHRLDGSQWTLDLYYDADPWESRLSASPPRVILQNGYRDGLRRELTWERLAPGHFSVTTSLEESTPIRAAIQVGGAALPIGPVVVGSGAEWRFDRERLSELRETATASGGGELVDLAKAWRRPTDPGLEPIFLPLVAAALVIFLLEALITRTGWKLPIFSFPRPRARRPKPVLASPAPAPAPAFEAPPKETATPPTPATDEGDTRKSRFRRAKKGL